MLDATKQRREEFWISFLSKLFVWGSLFGILYLLRSFSLLLFLVFIFSYVQANAVVRLERRIPRRTPRVVLVGVSFLAIFCIMVAVVVPRIRDQAVNLMNNSGTYVRSLDRELVRLTERYPAIEQMFPEVHQEATVPQPHEEWQFQSSTLAGVLSAFFGSPQNGEGKQSLITVFHTARDVGSTLLGISSQFLLSLLFSFLIVLDLPNLKKGAQSFRDTKLRFVYDEVADNLVAFGLTLGKAFEAQFVVATINTILTAVGLWAINIRDELTFLSLIVFICGFVPIAGVFISSIPICVLALAQDGFSKMMVVILLIIAVHAIESYILNPRIFGHHMKLNPVVVMILMTVSGKLFGVWGLLLCLPITTYIFQVAIQPKKKASEAGEEEPIMPGIPSEI